MIERETGKTIVLQYSTEWQHRNITQTSMITVKYKSTSQMICFKKFTNTDMSIVHSKSDRLEVFCFVLLFLKVS